MEIQYTDGVCKSNLSKTEIDNFMLTADKKNGNCVIDSWITWQKIMKLKPKRVRGIVNNLNIIAGSFDKTDEALRVHFWVEAKGMVYDINTYQTIILPINQYYEIYQISDAEIADEGNAIFTDNYKTFCGPDDPDDLEKHIIPERAKDIKYV